MDVSMFLEKPSKPAGDGEEGDPFAAESKEQYAGKELADKRIEESTDEFDGGDPQLSFFPEQD
jgi:hypothetical protein